MGVKGILKRDWGLSLVLAVILVASHPASAEFRDGNRLVKSMREFEKAERSDANTNYIEATSFTDYVVGVHDALETTGAFCSPDKATISQVASVVAKYLNAHPEEWSEPGSVLVKRALRQAFPCKGATTR